MEDKAIGLLLEIKSDIGELKGEVGEIKGELKARPCAEHRADILTLTTRVDQIQTTDLPEIRAKVAALSWWSTKRGKVLGAVVGLLLAITTGAATALVVKGIDAAAKSKTQTVSEIYHGQNH